MQRDRLSIQLLAGISLATLLTICGQAGAQTATPPNAQPSQTQAALQRVAEFEHQVTGVTVSKDGRIFVNFPRWTEDSPVSVAEVAPDGSTKPFPNETWNAWRNARRDELAPDTHWVCVQSVVADAQSNLWVLDPAAPAQGFVVSGGPKLVKIDLATNQVAQTILFDGRIAPQGSYLNDVRFSPDGRHAYITDSGVLGALIVVDLATAQSRRLLEGDASTQVERGYVVKADGQPLRRPDGRGVEFSADGIALSPDGAQLYWQAIKGTTLYRIATDALENTRLSNADLAARVERVGENGVADGLLIDRQGGRMYVTAPEDDAVRVRDLSAKDSGKPPILVQDKHLRWPDTLAQGPDGAIYVTTSRIQDMAWFEPESPAQLKTQLWRIDPSRVGEATGSVGGGPAMEQPRR